jgi:hypothetical protein
MDLVGRALERRAESDDAEAACLLGVGGAGVSPSDALGYLICSAPVQLRGWLHCTLVVICFHTACGELEPGWCP